ncbi:MAG TPA: O-antigen ligase family protein [Gaiellaceae bacterium]|nr:O-antigen ligase family protein [Gaiellaceae bacterium]
MKAHAVAPAAAVAAAAGGAAWLAAWNERGSTLLGDWMPGGLLVAALLVLLLLGGMAHLPSRRAVASLVGLVALAGWTALSLTWSPLPSLARDEALLMLVYVLAFALPAVTLRGWASALAATSAVAAASVALALAAGVALALGDAPERHFAIGRLEFPIGYANALATVFVLGLWPALALAARRTAPTLGRAAAVGGAGAVLAGWLATQSKGGGIAIVVSSVVVFALSRERLRLVAPTVLAAGAAAAAFRPLTEPYRAADELLRSASVGAGRAILLVAAGATVIGLIYALVDRAVELGPRARRAAAVATGASLAAAACAGALLFVANFGRPDDALRDAWEAFSTYHTDSGASHLVSLGGSNRYDFWRVSLEEAQEHPIAGIGARGFGAVYLQEGRSVETPARAHSLPLELLLEEGVIGLALLGLALVPALVAAGAAVRAGHAAAVASLGACTGWLAHATVDWTWTFAAAGIPFFLLLGCGSIGGADRRLLRPRTSLAAGAAVAVAAAVLLVPPWLSARLVEGVYADPSNALADLRRAQRLDPLAVRPRLIEAQLLPPAEAIPVLREAARMEPRSVTTRFLLGTTLLDAGRRREARAELEAALALSPRDELIARALARARGGA